MRSFNSQPPDQDLGWEQELDAQPTDPPRNPRKKIFEIFTDDEAKLRSPGD